MRLSCGDTGANRQLPPIAHVCAIGNIFLQYPLKDQTAHYNSGPEKTMTETEFNSLAA